MKIITLLLITISISFAFGVHAQEMNKWSLGLHMGGTDALRSNTPSGGKQSLLSPTLFNGNLRYMFNNRFGLMGSLQYNRFAIGDSRTNYLRPMIHGVANAGDILKFNSFAPRLGLLLHGGFGAAGMWRKDVLPANATSPYFDKVDEMLVWSFGFMPQVKLTEKWALSSDLSFNLHHKQHRTFDFTQTNTQRAGIDGSFVTVSLGLTYYLGKADKHADWTPTEYGMSDAERADLERKLAESEEANRQRLADLEEKLRVKDSDGDGIPDANDKCPEQAGPFSTNGCPDADGDGVPDHLDKCPNEAGPMYNEGCPLPEISTENTGTNGMLNTLYYDLNSSTLTSAAKAELNKAVTYLEQNPNAKISIEGHACSLGKDNINKNLSRERAIAVESYLKSKGIDGKRLSANGFGTSNLIDNGNSESTYAKNRRVELRVLSVGDSAQTNVPQKEQPVAAKPSKLSVNESSSITHEGDTYIIKEGETLYRVFLNTGVPVEKLKELNNLKSNTVYVGQVLRFR